MDNLKQYIEENRDEFDRGPMPQGNKERFMSRLNNVSSNKLQQNRKKGALKSKYVRLVRIATGIAAAMVISVFLVRWHTEKSRIPVMDNDTDYLTLMKNLEQEIIILSKECDRKTARQAIRASENVIYETIPITEQLPKELPDRKKAVILKQYYKEKTEGLRKIKTFLAMQTSEQE